MKLKSHGCSTSGPDCHILLHTVLCSYRNSLGVLKQALVHSLMPADHSADGNSACVLDSMQAQPSIRTGTKLSSSSAASMGS